MLLSPIVTESLSENATYFTANHLRFPYKESVESWVRCGEARK